MIIFCRKYNHYPNTIICQFIDLQYIKNTIVIAKNISEMAKNIKKHNHLYQQL